MSTIMLDDDFDDDLDDDDDDDDVSTVAPAPAPSITQTTATTPLTVTANPSPSATTAGSPTLTATNTSPFASGSTLSGVNQNSQNTLSDTDQTTLSNTNQNTLTGMTTYTTTNSQGTTTISAAAATLEISSSQTGTKSSGLSSGATAGIVIGVVIPVILIIVGILWYFRRNHKRKSRQRSSGSTAWGGSTAYGSTVEEEHGPPGDVDVSNPTEFYGITEVYGKDRRFEAPEAPVYELSPPTPVELEGDGVSGNGSRAADNLPSPLSSERSPTDISPVGTVATVGDSSTLSATPIVSPVENRTVARKAVYGSRGPGT